MKKEYQKPSMEIWMIDILPSTVVIGSIGAGGNVDVDNENEVEVIFE